MGEYLSIRDIINEKYSSQFIITNSPSGKVIYYKKELGIYFKYIYMKDLLNLKLDYKANTERDLTVVEYFNGAVSFVFKNPQVLATRIRINRNLLFKDSKSVPINYGYLPCRYPTKPNIFRKNAHTIFR